MSESGSLEDLQLDNTQLRTRIAELERKLEASLSDTDIHFSSVFQILGRRLSAVTTDYEAAKIVLETADDLIGWDSSFLGIYDSHTDLLTTIAEFDIAEDKRKEYVGRYFSQLTPGPMTRKVLDGEFLCGNRDQLVNKNHDVSFFGDNKRLSQCLLIAPLRYQNKPPFGILTIQSYEPDRFQEKHFSIFQSLAEFCSEAIARTYTETKLRLNEQRLNFALSGTNVGVWDWNLQIDKLRYSEKFAELLGYSLSEAESFDNFWQTHTQSIDMAEGLHKLTDHINGKTAQYEHRRRMRRKDGTWRWFLDRGKVVSFDNENNPTRMTGTITDITDEMELDKRQKEVESQLQQGQKMESLGLLAGGIAHDFNNLLVSICGNIEMALSKSNLPEPIVELLRDAEVGALQAAELTNQILAYAGKASLYTTHFYISDLVREMTKLLQVSISKKITTHLAIDQELFKIRGDDTQIRQVIMNLIKNSADAIGDQGGSICISTSLVRKFQQPSNLVFQMQSFTPGRFVCLEVSDTGCGMDEETQSKIFDPFFSTKEKGKGLGLAATLGIIRSHDGFAEIETVIDRGTTFRIYFPAIEVDENDSSSVVKISKSKSKSSSEMNPRIAEKGVILIIDDEQAVRSVARKMLESYDLNTIEANNGQSGLELYSQKSDRIAIVLLDLMMPVMDGIEVYRELRKSNPTQPILFSSGYNENASVSEIQDDHHARFIQKPYRKAQLMKKIRELLSINPEDTPFPVDY